MQWGFNMEITVQHSDYTVKAYDHLCLSIIETQSSEAAVVCTIHTVAQRAFHTTQLLKYRSDTILTQKLHK